MIYLVVAPKDEVASLVSVRTVVALLHPTTLFLEQVIVEQRHRHTAVDVGLIHNSRR